MKDNDCIGFLQWALPHLQMRWPGFRKVRRQVCKRIGRRLKVLGLDTANDYRGYLENHPGEWATLDACCHVTISRFYRDRHVFDVIGDEVLPGLAERALQRGDQRLNVWSAGCGAGEEAYSLSLLWNYRVQANWPDVALSILATDIDEQSLRRARQACYPNGSLKDLPGELRLTAFEEEGDMYCLRSGYRALVEFAQQDLREIMPQRCFDMILCRNLAFTYFDIGLQCRVLDGLVHRLRDGAALVIGAHETLPARVSSLAPWSPGHNIFRYGMPR